MCMMLNVTNTNDNKIDPHLGLIKVSPLMSFPLKTTFLTIHLLSTRPDII